MKKTLLLSVVVMSFFLLSACKKPEKSLAANDVQVNTLLLDKKGSIQSSLVEDFDKDYYNEQELRNFIEEAISKYNQKAGEDAVVMDSYHVKNGIASVVFTYTSIEDYADFNQVEAKLMSMEEAVNADILPDAFINAEDNSSIAREKVIENEKYQVLEVSEELDVIVDGKIKYFSNGALLNMTTVQTTGEDKGIIVFK